MISYLQYQPKRLYSLKPDINIAIVLAGGGVKNKIMLTNPIHTPHRKHDRNTSTFVIVACIHIDNLGENLAVERLTTAFSRSLVKCVPPASVDCIGVGTVGQYHRHDPASTPDVATGSLPCDNKSSHNHLQ